MASSGTAAQTLDPRPSYGAAAIAGFVVFALYVLTLSPDTAMWDTSEYIAAAYPNRYIIVSQLKCRSSLILCKNK